MTDKDDLISDVIYRLKIEYGQTLTFIKDNSTIDLQTGIVTAAPINLVVNLAIPLPINQRAVFLRSLGISRMGYLEAGQREILIDNTELNGLDPQELMHQYLVNGTLKEEVVRVENYDQACIVVVKS